MQLCSVELTMTFSPVKRVGASVSRPNSSAHAGAAPVATPKASAAARADVATTSRRVIALRSLHAPVSPSVAAAASSLLLGQTLCALKATGNAAENASVDPTVRRAQSAARVTDLQLAAILKLGK